MTITLSTHARARLAERFPACPVEAYTAIATTAFKAEKNSETLSDTYGKFLHYFAAKNEGHICTFYGGFFWIFSKQGLLVTVMVDDNGKAFRKWLSYQFVKA